MAGIPDTNRLSEGGGTETLDSVVNVSPEGERSRRVGYGLVPITKGYIKEGYPSETRPQG